MASLGDVLLSRLVAAVAMLCCFRCASTLETCSAGPQKVVVRCAANIVIFLVYTDVSWGAQVNLDKLMNCVIFIFTLQLLYFFSFPFSSFSLC